MRELTFPTIHLNGSSADDLIKQNRNAVYKIQEAMEALRKAAPHGRDYYMQYDGAFAYARTEHENRMTKLKEVFDELNEIVMDLYRQQPEK